MKTLDLTCRLTLMLTFDRMAPSPTMGGASKEVGPSSSVTREVATGLVGVAADGVVTVVTGLEPGEDAGKAGGNSLKPGLFGEGRRAEGERARFACTERESEVRVQFSILTSRGQQSQTENTWTHLELLYQG